MKCHQAFAGFLLASLAALATAPSFASCSRTLRLAWEDWPPYSIEGPDGAPQGLDIELISRIAAEAGCKLEYIKGVPSKRQQYYLRQGSLDVQFAASDVAERHAYAWFSLPYRTEIIRLFARPGEAARYPIKDLAELATRKWTLIAPHSGWFGARYESLKPVLAAERRLSAHYSNWLALQMLEARRGDLLLGDYYAVIHTKRVSGETPLDVLPVAVNEEPVHLMLSRKSLTPADVDAINAAIERLAKRGVLEDIANRYGVKPLHDKATRERR
ncbi:MAG TPA: transporter substrate-binding domain-containing protein [Paucimonas sp.]|nr:transporter substrate-binding domain-containing protein [Paucimonas sp.]